MKRLRILHRPRQFWHAIFAEPTAHGLQQAEKLLNPSQLELFRSMPSADQAHALHVLWTLHARKEKDPDLLVAALLHDIGKCRYPLNLWQRILVVLGGWFFPRTARRWGTGKPRGWRRPFVVAAQHPAWGAEMAARAGASPLTISLIWRHQETLSTVPETIEDLLLRTLQAADEDT